MQFVASRIYGQDSTKTIFILPGSKSLRQIQKDSATTLITLAGNAAVRQGGTLIYGDSIVVNQSTNIAEVFGHVHINDADTVNTYADYLLYKGKDRIAYLKKNVKLTDGKGTLLTNDLEYNIATGIANYKNGGKVLNDKTVLTSADATYFEDSKEVYFKKYVHLTDPKYDIKADSLLYNTQTKIATFISPTTITDGKSIINTKSGFYNLQTGQSEFYERTSMSDSTSFVIGDKIAYDEKSGIAQIEGNGKIVDSANHVIMLGNLLYLNKNTKSFLGTKKPVLIIARENDSTYIAADTLYSGIRKKDSTDNVLDTSSASNSNKLSKNLKSDSKNNSDTVRYFLGFNHVKIYNDSLQAVCDSMYYSTADSVFRMFREPVFWNDKTQVNGDTMYLYTKNQKPKRLYVFYNSYVISKENDAMYNQIKGKTLNAYFKDGSIDYIRVKGSPAESIFYPQDDDSAYTGLNKCSGDVIDIFFENKELDKVKFINQANGTFYPLRFITDETKQLEGFLWQDKRRPKNKLEIFE